MPTLAPALSSFAEKTSAGLLSTLSSLSAATVRSRREAPGTSFGETLAKLAEKQQARKTPDSADRAATVPAPGPAADLEEPGRSPRQGEPTETAAESQVAASGDPPPRPPDESSAQPAAPLAQELPPRPPDESSAQPAAPLAQELPPGVAFASRTREQGADVSALTQPRDQALNRESGPSQPLASALTQPREQALNPESGPPQPLASDLLPAAPAGRDRRMVDRSSSRTSREKESASTLSPAAARALQVDAAVRLENATGQPPLAQIGLRAGGGQAFGHGVVVTQPGEDLVQPHPVTAAEPSDRFSARIVRGLSAMVNQRGGVMNMRLDPPDLGALRVQMTIARGVVTAEFQATTQQAQALLERGLTGLRAALESQGLTVERLSVQLAAPASPQATREEAPNQHGHQPQRDQAGDDRPEGKDHEGRDRGEDGRGDQPEALLTPESLRGADAPSGVNRS